MARHSNYRSHARMPRACLLLIGRLAVRIPATRIAGNGEMATSPVEDDSMVFDDGLHTMSLRTYRRVNEMLAALPPLPPVLDLTQPVNSSDCGSQIESPRPRRKRLPVVHQATRHSARLDDLHFCPHCQNWLCKSTFNKHQRRFRSGEQWLDNGQAHALLNGKRPRSPAVVDPYADYNNSAAEELAEMIGTLEAQSGFDIHNNLADIEQQLENASESEASDENDADDCDTSAASEDENECEALDDFDDSSSSSLATMSELEDAVMTFLEAKCDLGDGE